MSAKTFISPNRRFSLTLPEDWDEYDDGEEDTFAFFNSKSWTGNFRITAFRWTNVTDPKEDKAAKFIENELSENIGATELKLSDFVSAHYKKDIEQDGDSLVVYYWVTGKQNDLFICSFTIDKAQESAKKNQTELKIVENIITSIKIN